MNAIKKFRFPILIGGGVLAAGVLLYVSNGRINSRMTQGAIGQRDVYRDAQVNPADIASPGDAPVAAKVLLESKEFQSLAKNEAFHNLLADESFARLARNSHFLALLQDANFLELMNNPSFARLLSKSGADLASRLESGDSQMLRPLMSKNSQDMSKKNAQDMVYKNAQDMSKKSAQDMSKKNAQDSMSKNAQDLLNNRAFQDLSHNANFLELLKNQVDSQDLAHWGLGGNNLIQSAQFQKLLGESSFRSALHNGMASRLSSEAMRQSVAKK